jgi:hypothetical protein
LREFLEFIYFLVRPWRLMWRFQKKYPISSSKYESSGATWSPKSCTSRSNNITKVEFSKCMQILHLWINGGSVTYSASVAYSLRPKINVVLAFKFYPTKSVLLACSELHLIKAIPSTKKILYRKTHRTNQILSRYYFSSSNTYVFIEDSENQINNTVFNHNC